MAMGMLWFDDSPKPFEEKIEEARIYFREKYGRDASICYISPKTLAIEGLADLPTIPGITLTRRNNVLVGHLQLESG